MLGATAFWTFCPRQCLLTLRGKALGGVDGGDPDQPWESASLLAQTTHEREPRLTQAHATHSGPHNQPAIRPGGLCVSPQNQSLDAAAPVGPLPLPSMAPEISRF